MPSDAETLANSDRACLVAAAGCGKTHLIAQSIEYCGEGRQLILTHTNAGVHSLKRRLKLLGVSSSRYHVSTIAQWAHARVLAYPVTCGYSEDEEDFDWQQVYISASQLLNTRFFRRVVQSTYAGVFVDEYQDCDLAQHDLILALAEALPCRVLGDPLQAIFEFAGDSVNWTRDVETSFKPLPELTMPYRWEHHGNIKLGRWLVAVREKLLAGREIELPPSVFVQLSNGKDAFKQQQNECFRRSKSDSVVAIHQWPHECHTLARYLKGTYSSIEEMEAKDLLKWARKLEQTTGTERAVVVIEFGKECVANIAGELSSVEKAFASGRTQFKGKKGLGVASALESVALHSDMTSVLFALDEISKIEGRTFFRRELWEEMKKSIRLYSSGGYPSLQEAARQVRHQTSIMGRRSEKRIVSRTLLVKGLEFDNAIILNADNLDRNNLYVAMTRGKRSLTILAKNPIIKPKS